jgi:hypothetical protein
VNAPVSLKSDPRQAAGPSIVRIGIGGASVDSALARLPVMVIHREFQDEDDQRRRVG